MYKVIFLTSTGKFDIDDIPSIFQKKFKAFAKIGDFHQIAIGKGSTICNGMHLHLVSKRTFPIIAFLKGFHIIKKNKIQIIYCQSPLIDGCVGVLLKWFTRKKLIIGVHGNWNQDIKNTKPKAKYFLWLINRIAKFNLNQADNIRVISYSTFDTAQEFATNGKIFPTHFPSLFDVEYFLEGIPPKPIENSAVFIGNPTKTKGFDILQKAVPIVKLDYPDFKVYVFGKGNQIPTEGIIYKGYQPKEVIKEHLDKAKLIVAPSRTEGLGRAVLEGMARARPVVASNVGGLKESVADNITGYLVKPEDEIELANMIKLILEEPTWGQIMGNNGRQYVKNNYSTKTYIENYTKLFEETLKC